MNRGIVNIKNKKLIRIILLIGILSSILLLPACGNSADNKQKAEENVETNTMEKTHHSDEYPVYQVQSIDNLQLGSEEFNLDYYFIRNEYQYPNYYYIDSDNNGDNTYGQLGNGRQYTSQDDPDNSFEKIPQKIAENVVHVDFGGYFVIFLTESGELYGIGANLNGVMGIDVSENEDYITDPAETVVSKPACLMKDVQYARAGMRGITALKKDGSVWWWGEVRTTSAKNIEDTAGVRYTKPEKMLENAIYVTCGKFCAAAIKEDGTLWTWGNNTFGSCGYDSGNEDFIEKPVMVLDDVKMVWMDEARFDSIENRLSYGAVSPYECDYTYVTFAEKKDGSLLACGYEVAGEGSKSWSYMLYGDILRTPDQMNGSAEESPVTVVYSDVFQQVAFHEKDRNPQLQFRKLKYGMSSEEVTEDQYFTFWFDNKHGLNAFSYSAYGTRNGKINIEMTKEEVEEVLKTPFSEETSPDYDGYITSFYQDDSIYEIGYFDGVVYYVKESMIDKSN